MTMGAPKPVPIGVRQRLASDLDALVSILAAVQEKDGYPANMPADPAGWLNGERTRASWVATGPDGTVLGQVSRAAAAGDNAASVWSAALLLPVEGLAVVKRLFVDPAARGLGVGRRLLDTVVDDAHRLGLHPVLDVDATSEAANAMYESAGFRLVATIPLSWTGLERTFHANCYVGPAPYERRGQ